jgi:hypothetical protein
MYITPVQVHAQACQLLLLRLFVIGILLSTLSGWEMGTKE